MPVGQNWPDDFGETRPARNISATVLRKAAVAVAARAHPHEAKRLWMQLGLVDDNGQPDGWSV